MNQILVAHFAAAPALSLQPPMLRVSASQQLRTRAVWLRQRAEHAHHRSRTLDACAQHLCHVAARLCSAPLLLPRARDALQHAELLRRVRQAREVG